MAILMTRGQIGLVYRALGLLEATDTAPLVAVPSLIGSARMALWEALAPGVREQAESAQREEGEVRA